MYKVLKNVKKATAIVLLTIVFVSINSVAASATTVNDVTELKNAVSTANDKNNIKLSDNFSFDEVEITLPNVDVTIEGGNKLWNTGSINVIGDGTGNLTIRNLQVESNTFIAKHTNGNLYLDNMTFSDAKKGAISVTTSGSGNTTISDSIIQDNSASNNASAIWLAPNSNLIIQKSTIKNNVSTGGGYECGAIASKNYRGNLEINNTVLQGNKNKCANTGVFGGGGGAMSFHYLFGNIKINESYFKGNETNGEGVDIKNTYDGGAIYILDGRDGATFTVDKSTFDSNIAYDDGGAMLIQGTGNPGLTTKISNSTFYNNKAYGLDGGNHSGGAIQFFKNGGSSQMNNSVIGVTFIKNEAGNDVSTLNQRGGAIGLSGAGTFATAALTRNNTLFAGNSVYNSSGEKDATSSYKDISNYTITQLNNNLINIDKGSVPQYTLEDVIGTDSIMLSDNYSTIKAGKENNIVPTVSIKPEGLADNTNATQQIDNDQRGYNRNKDIGAVEIAWTKYNSNTGNWKLPKLVAYDGSIYYEGTTPENYYTVGHIGKTNSVVNSTNLTKVGYTFKEWNTQADGSGTGYEENTLATTTEDLTLYAIWTEDVTYMITYDGNSHTAGDEPKDTKDYKPNGVGSVLGKGSLVKDGYTFKEWNTQANGNGVGYKEKDPITLTDDVTLYAIWSKDITYTITYHGNSHTAGDEPKDTMEYKPNDVGSVLGKGSLVKDGYTFKEWNTQAAGNGIGYKENNIITLTDNVTLYAVWTKDSSTKPDLDKPVDKKPEKKTVKKNDKKNNEKNSIPKTGVNTMFVSLIFGLITLLAIIFKKKYKDIL